MCAALDLGIGAVLYPFMLRRVAAEERYSDITGPLIGYSGAFGWNLPTDAAGRFWALFNEWTGRQNIVSSFARLSLFPEDLVPFDGRIRIVQPNVVRDLQVSDDDLWKDVEHKVRKNVIRARSAKVTVEVDLRCEQIDLFQDIYAETMRRRGAEHRYFLDADFFSGLIGALGSSIQLYVARVGTSGVATELVLTSTHHAYSFLGGTRASAFNCRPNDLLKYEIIRHLRDQGLRHFVLGGGPSPGDEVFRYKRSFAPGGVVDFKVGEKIHDPAAYEYLVRQRVDDASAEGTSRQRDSSFFPAYRAV